MTTQVKTNNIPRPIINGWELTPKQRAEFDYLDWEDDNGSGFNASFFRYQGRLYDLGEFCRVISPTQTRSHPTECAAAEFQGWDGYLSDSYFSGLLIRYANDFESVVVARYTS